MASGVEYPTEKRAEILALRALGRTVREITEATGVAQPTIYQWRDKDPDFREAWDVAIRVWREYRKDLAAERKDWLDDKLYEIAGIDGDARQMDAIKTLHKAMSEQVQRFEIVGDPARPIMVGHEARLTLAHVLGLAERLGLNEPRPQLGTSGELPAAREILAEPPQG